MLTDFQNPQIRIKENVKPVLSFNEANSVSGNQGDQTAVNLIKTNCVF